ncbi:HAD family hydrolase [Streptomyces sp. NPDC003247]|uniref:HAD family hydrolase n=1 Tax=Streptomyces sp. NPDC003247 TaxID=3364677 RepID=UPI0036C4261D
MTAESSEFRELVVGAKVVLWDFDGPICRLFAGCPAQDVAHALVRWLRERGLAGRGLTSCFASPVHGRTADLGRLEPPPHTLHRALAALDAAPRDALAIGDSPTDALAAAEAGVPFLGYARREAQAAPLRAAGVTHVVASLEQVLTEVRRTGPVRACVSQPPGVPAEPTGDPR